MVLQPLFMGRWYAMRRAQAIRALEKSHASRVITMILRQEKRSLFGFAVSRHIDLEDADRHWFPLLVRAPHRRLRCMGNLLCMGLIL